MYRPNTLRRIIMSLLVILHIERKPLRFAQKLSKVMEIYRPIYRTRVGPMYNSIHYLTLSTAFCHSNQSDCFLSMACYVKVQLKQRETKCVFLLYIMVRNAESLESSLINNKKWKRTSAKYYKDRKGKQTDCLLK